MSVAQAVLLVIGLAAVVLSAAGLLAARDPYRRLHFLAPASTIGAPAVLAAAMLAGPAGRPTAKLAAIGLMLLLTAPALTMATARSRAQQDGHVEGDDPR